jgi:hypothetical protein
MPALALAMDNGADGSAPDCAANAACGRTNPLTGKSCACSLVAGAY